MTLLLQGFRMPVFYEGLSFHLSSTNRCKYENSK